MSFPQYPEYKDAGVEWLGEVPAHWGVSPFKWQIEANDSGAWGDDPAGANDSFVLRSTDQTVDGRWEIKEPALRHLSTKERASTVLKAGDLVVTKSSGSSLHIGKTTLVDEWIASKGFSFGNFMQRIRTKDSFCHKLAWYLMNNGVARLQLDLLSNSTTGLANLNGTTIGEIQVATPPLDEQAYIVSFLDHETARIDALVEEQRLLIELLKEKRQAVISHAVTKGLDPDVPMKDSGVEWLGEVPAHWMVGPLRWYATIQGGIAKGKRYDVDIPTVELPYLRVANVQDGYVDLSKVNTVTVAVSEIERFSLQSGDVLMNEGGDNDKLGRGAVWDGEIADCLHQNHVFAIRPNQYLSSCWLSIFSRSSAARSYFYLYSKQSTNLASISGSNVMSCPLPIPPIKEQRRILKNLQKQMARIEMLMEEGQNSIDLLQERRSALISAAVTGKIDVRGWQRPPGSSSSTEATAGEPI